MLEIQLIETILARLLSILIKSPTAIPKTAAIIILSVKTEMNTLMAMSAAPKSITPKNVQRITDHSGVVKKEMITA